MHETQLDHFKQRLLQDKRLRIELIRKSFLWFSVIYFQEHLKYHLARYQFEMIHLAESSDNLVIVAFRGSGKSTIINLMCTLWSVMGIQNKKSLAIISRTQDQARQHFANIKRELETNLLLKSDLGPFQEDKNVWNASSLILTDYDARITAVSMDQSIRGIKHGANRPDFLLCDDLEDTNSVKTQKERDKTFEFFKSELIMAGDTNTRVIVIGNLLHEDSLIMRLKKEIDEGKIDYQYREYPFLDDQQKCLWPQRFPTEANIENEKKRVGNEKVWMREMLLKIVPSDRPIIHYEWLQFYNPNSNDYK